MVTGGVARGSARDGTVHVMAVVLSIGRAGSGRTEEVRTRLRELVREGDRRGRFPAFQILVPTYSRAEHLKRSLVRGDDQVAGMFDRGIGTFEQLAERVTGRRLADLAPRAVRDALVERAIEEHASDRFRSVGRFPGFRRSILRFVAEVKGADPPPVAGRWAPLHALERLALEAERRPDRSGDELRRLVEVSAAYVRLLRDGGWIDHEDLLRELLDRLREETEPRRLEYLAVDGFADLTEVQERIVQVLAARAEETVVTLLGPNPDLEGGAGPFVASEALRERLGAVLKAHERVLVGNRRAGGDLARLERSLAGEAVEVRPADGSVRFLAGADADDEADRVARTVVRWLAEGVRRRDILVVVRRAASSTAARVLEALRRHGVDTRWSGGVPLASVPSARSTLRVLRLLAGIDRAGDVRAALHGGDARGVPDESADAFEELARVRGGSGWDRLVEQADDHPAVADWLQRLDRARGSLEPAPPEVVARTLLERVPSLLRFSFEGRIDSTRERDAARDAAALRVVQRLVGDVAHGLRAAGRQLVEPAVLVRQVEALFPEEVVRSVDRRADVLNVVDAEEARQWEARAVVVCGLRLGEFPGAVAEDLFVPDEERARITRQAGVRLPARRDAALARERLLFYSAVTRSTERLVLTTHRFDASGDPVPPSPFLEQALSLLPIDERRLSGADRSPGDVRPEPDEVLDAADVERVAWSMALERHAPGSEGEQRARLGAGLLQDVHAEPDGRARLIRAARGYVAPIARLRPDGAARAWLARPRVRSASSLGSFAHCAYLHFARKGLGLDEPDAAPEDGLDPLRTGTLAHDFLEQAVRAGLSDEGEVAALFERIWDRHTEGLPRDLALAAKRRELREALVPQVVRWAAQGLVRGFSPERQEQVFGKMGGERDDDAPEPLDELRLGDGESVVRIRGAIDRIDRDRDGRLLVVDYKWSNAQRYSGLERKMERGQDLQAALYALALSRTTDRPVLASGYLTLRDARLRWIRLHEDAPKSSGRAADVDWSDDPEGHLRDLERRLVRLDRLIREGHILASPLDASRCGPGSCSMAHLCRIQDAPPERRRGGARDTGSLS